MVDWIRLFLPEALREPCNWKLGFPTFAWLWERHWFGSFPISDDFSFDRIYFEFSGWVECNFSVKLVCLTAIVVGLIRIRLGVLLVSTNNCPCGLYCSSSGGNGGLCSDLRSFDSTSDSRRHDTNAPGCKEKCSEKNSNGPCV